jgi:Domain of unknown function (DUF4349)/Putative zinc-finger
MTAETHPIDKVLVMAYLDGELAPEQAAKIAIHLERCAECRELVAELRGISSRILAWSVDPALKRVNDAVLEALSKSGTKSKIGIARQAIPHKFAWMNLPRNRWAWAALAFVVLCFVGYRSQRHQSMGLYFSPRPGAREAASLPMERNRLQMFAKLEPAESESLTGPMIARTASLSISVRDINAARLSLDRVVHGHLGYVSSLNISAEKGTPQALTAKVMIPAAQMDSALADLKALGLVEQEQQGGEEVTSQVMDLDARLKNARETETQLTDILRTRTGKISDVLEVEKEMARVRGEIEIMQAEQKRLSERVDFGSIDFNLSEEYEAQIGGGPWLAGHQIRNALVDGYHAAADGLVSVCVFLFTLVPSLLLWGLILFWPVRWAWRHWQKARAQGEPSI